MSGLIIDVSQYQGVINWNQIRADQVDLAIIKATEGVGFVDPRFAQNWAGAAAAGVPRGAYHFAHPDTGNNAIAEAQFFVNVVKSTGLTAADVLAEDYEVLGGGAQWSLDFLAEAGALTGTLLEFYSNYSGCARVNDPRMAQYPLWLAYPGDGVHAPICPAPWKSIALWQYRVGSVPGITGNVDEDVSLGLFAAGADLITSHSHQTHYSEDSDMAIVPHPTVQDRVDVYVVGRDGNISWSWGTTDQQRSGIGGGAQPLGLPPGGGGWRAGGVSVAWYLSSQPSSTTTSQTWRLVVSAVRDSDGAVFIRETDFDGRVVTDWTECHVPTGAGPAALQVASLALPSPAADDDSALSSAVQAAQSAAASAQAAAAKVETAVIKAAAVLGGA